MGRTKETKNSKDKPVDCKLTYDSKMCRNKVHKEFSRIFHSIPCLFFAFKIMFDQYNRDVYIRINRFNSNS